MGGKKRKNNGRAVNRSKGVDKNGTGLQTGKGLKKDTNVAFPGIGAAVLARACRYQGRSSFPLFDASPGPGTLPMPLTRSCLRSTAGEQPIGPAYIHELRQLHDRELNSEI